MARTPDTRKPARPSPGRAAVVAGRWGLAVAGAVAIALGFGAGNPFVRAAAFALLGFLLANALWQHLPLARACVAGGAVAVLYGAAVALYQLFASDAGLAGWFPDALGAVVGAAIAYAALPRIDRLASSARD